MSIDRQEVVRLYVEEELGVREIATRCGCSYGHVYNLLLTRVVMRHPVGRRRRSLTYLKVADAIRDAITAGTWKPGDKIPSRLDLAEMFAATDQTITQAVAHLRQHRYLEPRPSNGTYVRPEQDWITPP